MPSGACIRKQASSRIQLPTSSHLVRSLWSGSYSVNAPPRDPGLWSMPPATIIQSAFKTLMTAQIHSFQATPVTTTFSRAARWDKLKVDTQDVARNYCSTSQRTGQLRVLRVRASQAPAAFLAAPGSHHALDELRDIRQQLSTLAATDASPAATDALRAVVLLHEYGDQSTCCIHYLHRQRQPATVISHLQQQQGMAGRQQADSIIVNFISADSPRGMFRQLPTALSAQQSLLSPLDKQMPSDAQQACKAEDMLDELHAPLKLSARGKKPGSDVLPYEFFSQYWELLGPELLTIWLLDHQVLGHEVVESFSVSLCRRLPPLFFVFFFLVARNLSTLRHMMKIPNKPGLSSNNGLKNAFLIDQSMASNPRKGQAKRLGAKTTSHDGKAGLVMTHVCHRPRQK